MNIEELREFCLSVKEASEGFPFNETVLVFKVANKMFLYTDLESVDGFRFNVKCDPQKAIELRKEYEGIVPGHHASKKHWNTIQLESDVPEELIKKMILDSVDEVLKTLSKKKRDEYLNS